MSHSGSHARHAYTACVVICYLLVTNSCSERRAFLYFPVLVGFYDLTQSEKTLSLGTDIADIARTALAICETCGNLEECWPTIDIHQLCYLPLVLVKMTSIEHPAFHVELPLVRRLPFRQMKPSPKIIVHKQQQQSMTATENDNTSLGF
jgi:hypothetical protein